MMFMQLPATTTSGLGAPLVAWFLAWNDRAGDSGSTCESSIKEGVGRLGCWIGWFAFERHAYRGSSVCPGTSQPWGAPL